MELEVSYNENYCVEGQVERRRGAPESIDGGAASPVRGSRIAL